MPSCSRGFSADHRPTPLVVFNILVMHTDTLSVGQAGIEVFEVVLDVKKQEVANVYLVKVDHYLLALT
jgi:hypothetical protein